MRRGKVLFWKQDMRDNKTFGWGFIAPDDNADERVYFNQRTARYSPVHQHDLVEFEMFETDNVTHPGRLAAFKVEKLNDER
jgi:hypothetical protein